ncbi:MAG: VOC family protein [Balneolaceae bacterium]
MITPYLFFPGNCEEAINFYKTVFKGEITFIQRFGEANMPVDENYRKKIMHASLEFAGTKIQFSDGAPHRKITPGDNVHLSLNFDNETKMRLTWSKLAAGGSVHMELQDTFWGAIYGQLEDKFGMRWMFNFQKES